MTLYFPNELPLNHEPSLNHWARRQADNDIASGYHKNWDYAYEQAWQGLDAEFTFGGGPC